MIKRGPRAYPSNYSAGIGVPAERLKRELITNPTQGRIRNQSGQAYRRGLKQTQEAGCGTIFFERKDTAAIFDARGQGLMEVRIPSHPADNIPAQNPSIMRLSKSC
jgi:hypothetical protein